MPITVWIPVNVWLCVVSLCVGSHILMIPHGYGLNSRLRDEIQMAELLIHRGHHITVLINADDQVYFDHISQTNTGKNSGGLDFITFPYPADTWKFNSEAAQDTMTQRHFFQRLDTMNFLTKIHIATCETILGNNTLKDQLKVTQFNLLIIDMMDICSRILITWLNLPTVAYCSHGTFPDMVFYPELSAIIPAVMTTYGDEMTFLQRVQNTLAYAGCLYVLYPILDFRTYLLLDGKNITFNGSLSSAYWNAMVLVGVDFVIEYPRPFMPNVIPVGGWYVKDAKPVSSEINDFINSGQSDCVVYVSFGTLVSNKNKGLAHILVEFFAKFPTYKFIWKYNGLPVEVPDNVLQKEWVKQNDILGDSKTCLFITHGGSHSAYETLYHGVPVVAIPIFADQPMVAQRLVNRLQMGVLVDYDTLSVDSLSFAVNEVQVILTIRTMLLDSPRNIGISQ